MSGIDEGSLDKSWTKLGSYSTIKQIKLFNDSILTRLLPTFNSIEEEAESYAEATWEEIGKYADPDTDPSDAAETAQNAGIEHYQMLGGIKQALINISATALFHIFEQQAVFLLRREILERGEHDDPNLMNLKTFKQKLLEDGVDINSFSSWEFIDELKLVANSVKHAEGRSAVLLREKRPDLFIHPMMKNPPFSEIDEHYVPDLFMPLAGEDIYLSQADLTNYQNALVKFWEQFIDLLKRKEAENSWKRF